MVRTSTRAAREAQTAAPAHTSAEPVRWSESGAFVLLVDDSEDDLYLASRTLRRAGVSQRIVTATDGLEVLDLIQMDRERGRALPLLLVIDLDLPRQSGLEVVRLLRAGTSTARLPVIVLTGCAQGAATFPTGDFGNAVFVVKPLTVENFQRAVRELCVDDVLEADAMRRTT